MTTDKAVYHISKCFFVFRKHFKSSTTKVNLMYQLLKMSRNIATPPVPIREAIRLWGSALWSVINDSLYFATPCGNVVKQAKNCVVEEQCGRKKFQVFHCNHGHNYYEKQRLMIFWYVLTILRKNWYCSSLTCMWIICWKI
jgi:hypothetical protein